MTTQSLAFGQRQEDGDTWFLIRRQGILLLDAAFADNALEHPQVSVAGHLGFPASNPGVEKLIVEKIATHAAIAARAYALFEAHAPGSATDHWLRAERELLQL